MAFITADRVKDTSITTGTGNITVSGGAPSGYRTFSTVLSVGDTFYYCVTGQASSEWEVGLGTYLSTNTFARTTVLASSASGSAVSFSSGTKNVFITLPANKTLQLNAAASPTAGAILYGTGSMLAYTAVGTSGQFLQSTGSGAPTWAPLGSVGTSISNGTSNVNIASSNGAVTVATNGTTAMTVSTSQNVGIGTASPGYPLDVNGLIGSKGGALTTRSSAATSGFVYNNFYDATGNIAILCGAYSDPSNQYRNTIHIFGSVSGTTEYMRINSSGNMGIGTSLPGNAKLNVQGYGSYRGDAYTIASFCASSTLWPLNITQRTDGTIPCISAGQNNSGTWADGLGFMTNGQENMRIDVYGNLLVGATTVNYAGDGCTLSKDSGTTKWLVGPVAAAPTNFYVTAAASLGVYLAGTSATSWSSASDERLKDIIEPIEGGLQKVNALRAVIGSYKADEAKTRRAFLIAQDLQNVLPEAVDASNPDALGVQYTEVIPLLVAAIKELSAKNDALEARLAALEAK